jgi:uncharacterized protein YqeY
MSLEQKINDDIREAMLAKDKRRLEALRAVKAAILLARTDKGTTGEIEAGAEMKILQKLVKQRRESADIYKQQNRADLVAEEEFQLSVISKYLPEQMSEQEVRHIIREIIAETGATSVKDMGKVMGNAAKKLSGRADNKTISTIVKEMLGG